MKKIIAALLCLLYLAGIVPALGEASLRVAALKGPTAMGMVQMMAEYPDDYQFTISGAVDEISPKLLKGEVDIAAIPANLGANLYNKTNGEILALCVNTLGVLYIVENGDSVQSLEDLRGKTIYASGKGATPEYVLRYILQVSGIDPDKDVTIEYQSEHTQCLAELLAHEGSVALLPQPFVTSAQMKQPSVRTAIDLNTEWERLGQGQLITGLVVVRKAYLEENQSSVDRFLERYAVSVAYVNEHAQGASSLIEQYGILAANVAEAALPYCRIVCLNGEKMLQSLPDYFRILYNQDPASIGGALPDEAFYYIP